MLVTRLTIAALVVWAASAADPVLAPTGTLRATFLQSNPVQGRVDAKTGTVSGPAAELARELGRQLGVSVSITGVVNARAVIDSLKNRTADIGFLAVDASRAVDVDFSNPYSLSWSSYIVRGDSPLRDAANADRTGIRIGAAAADSPQIYLADTLNNATLKAYVNPPAQEVLRMLGAGEFDAWAANRQRLIEMAAGNSGFRVLNGNFTAVRQAIAVPKGDRAALDLVNRFLAGARSSGLIGGAIERAGLSASVDVAP